MTKTTYKFTRLPDESQEFHPASREKNQRDSRIILQWLMTGAFVMLMAYVIKAIVFYAVWVDAAATGNVK